VWTPKGTYLRHNACFELLCVKIHLRVTSVALYEFSFGKSFDPVRGKNNNNKKRPYISRISPSPEASLWWIGTNFWLRVRLIDIINFAKFYRNRLRGLVSVKGRSLRTPIGLRCRC